MMMKPAHWIAVAAFASLGLAACSTTSSGMGGGELSARGRANENVMFTWQSSNGGISGSLVATLPNATYTGRFVQITGTTASESLEPMWIGWNEGWGDWPYWSSPFAGGVYDVTRFSRYYSGKVVANLQSDGGQRMRCRLHLEDPSRGMSGGGSGECQLAGGKVISATIDRS